MRREQARVFAGGTARAGVVAFAGLIAFAGLVAFADVARADLGPMPALGAERAYQPPRVQRLRLAGGGQLWVVPDTSLPLVAVRAVIPGAGSAADPPGRGGLADYTAALLYEGGAGELGGRALAERLEDIGSQLVSWAEID